nr:MAG TPA: hypothetical protein [Caudoviricetes sp.]
MDRLDHRWSGLFFVSGPISPDYILYNNRVDKSRNSQDPCFFYYRAVIPHSHFSSFPYF